MASIITIADAAPAPVNRNFVPNGLDQNTGAFWWVDASAPNALGYWRIGLSITRPPQAQARQSSDGRNYRVKVQVLEPVLANLSNSTVSGVAPVPQLSYSMRSYHEFVLAEAGTQQDRKHIAKMSPLILQNPQITQVITDLLYPGT
mgnify:FL=1